MSELAPVILVDTREQRALPITAYPVQTATLPVGDYGLLGFSDWRNPQFICERKSVSDLVGSLTHDRERFEKDVLKLRQFRFAALLIEAERLTIEIGQYSSGAKPESILSSLAAFQVRGGLHVLWCGDSKGAARMLERLARQFCRGIEKDHRRLLKAASAPAASVEG